MFKMKTHHNGTGLLKRFEQGSEVFADKVSDGLKIAEDQIKHLGQYVKENDDLTKAIHYVKKDGGMIAISVMGVGLLLFGLYNLIKE